MSSKDPRVGTRIGSKYEIVRFIQEGGMGAVYEAKHLFVRRRFAIKFLRRDLARRRDVLARFKHEAQAAGALEHENIAAVVDFGVDDDGTPYLVMEYLEGVDLAHLLDISGVLPVERATDLVLQAALGADVAHRASVIHRDLKPHNLFLCRRGDGTDLLKVLDFGVAKLETTGSAITRTGAMLGTPAYMAPEQARGETSLDARTDVYALGVILYELLSGRTPHPGDTPNAIIHHIATENPLPLPGAAALPSELVELVQRALSTSREDRPTSAAQLAHELEPFAKRKAWPPTSSAAVESELGYESTLQAPATSHPSELSFPASLLESRDHPHGRRLRSRAPWLLFTVLLPSAALATWWLGRESPTAPTVSSATTSEPQPTPALVTPLPPVASHSPAPPPPRSEPPPPVASERSTTPAKRPNERPRAPPARVAPTSEASVPRKVLPEFDAHNPYQ